MRRVLLGGLGLALGVFASPAVGQVVPGGTAASRSAPSQDRAARLGRPVAADAPPARAAAPAAEPGVTPVGLFSRGQPPAPVVLPGSPIPMSTGQPITFGQPMPGTPPVIVGQPMPIPMTGGTPPGTTVPAPPPTVKPSAPNVTEIRDPATGIPAVGAPAVGTPVPMVIPGATLVPSVLPGTPIQQPCLENPMFCGPGASAMDRVCCNNKWWFNAEYLLWWTRSANLPTLAATGPTALATGPNGVAQVVPTTPLLNGTFDRTLHGGARFSGGWWFCDDQCRGIDLSYFFLGRNGSEYTANTNQYPVLLRPFTNINDPQGTIADVIGFPGVATGALAVQLNNQLWGAQANYRRNLARAGCARLDGLVGFRYLNFTESLTITETSVLTPDSPLAGVVPTIGGTITDRFSTANNFYGGQIGMTGEVRRGRWFVDGRATIAFGTVFQSAEIAGGQNQVYADGSVGQFQGGLLALPGANIGRFSQNKFAVAPEVGLNIGYHITPHFRVFVGYNFLYLSSVLRPSDVIDTTVDAARIPNFPLPNGASPLPYVRPTPQFRTTDFFAQGINFGISFSW